MSGRPSKLTEYTTARIISSLSRGNYRYVACQTAGITITTFERWMSDERGPYREFRAAVEKAEAEAEERLLGIIEDAAPNTWQAAAWMLERKYPERWGVKARIEVESLLRAEARSLAAELGVELDEESIVAEASAILARRS